MEEVTIYDEDKIIYQHNAITSGRYDFSACMLDILFMVLAQLKPDVMEYDIYTADIENITGRKWNISQLTKTTELMLTRMFEIEDLEKYRQFVLFQCFDYLKGNRTIRVRLSDVSLPYFFELKNNFTVMQLKSLLSCSSKYAKRLYALACQWRSVGFKKMEILELKKMLELVDKKGYEQYENITDFKKNVLDIAKGQINENTDIEFDYKLTKRGRSFHFITLYFNGVKQVKQLELPLDFNQDLEYQRKFKSITAYGISEALAEKWAKKQDAWLAFVESKNATKERALKGEIIENFPAYIVGVMKKKGFN